MQLSELFLDSPHLEHVVSVQDGLASGDLNSAQKALVKQLTQYPNAAVLHYLMSEIMIKAGRMGVALKAAAQACNLEPGNTHFLAHSSYTLLQAVQLEAALRTARSCWSAGVDHAITADVLGNTFTGCGELNEALRAYRLAVELSPAVPHFQFNLATALRATGDMEGAERCYDRVITARPTDWKAYRNRSDLRTQTSGRNHVQEMEKRLPLAQKNPRGAYQLCGALAKELSDLEQYESSWRYLKRSADLRRSMISYSVDGDVDVMQALSDAFDEGVMDQGGGCESEEPIFILGLPRTGSTLLERMLGSHSEVYAAGELQNFVAHFMALVRTTFPNEALDKTALANKSTRLDFARLGQSYLDSTRPRTGKTRFFIDKMPMNFLYVGLIHLALPNAKIIHLTRHPMDTCYAIYKTPFDQAYPYSYDLGDLAKYYIAYRKLMDHWNKVLPPGTIHNLSYEGLVTDTENELERVLEYCNLSYQPACLEFHNSNEPTNTASASQVRQPVYTSSVAKWRHVEAGLTPLSEELSAAGINLD